MQFTPTEFPGLYVCEPKVFGDNRGFFMETYSKRVFAAAGLDMVFVQDNHAKSKEKGVLRGLHFQAPPAAQAKLVWVTAGAVCDVVVDIRAGSPTYGRWFKIELSACNFKRLFIPKGFAHGYQTLEPNTEFQYKVDAFYSPEHDAGIAWNDPDLDIDWPEADPVLSDKDVNLPTWSDFSSPFTF